MHVPPNFETALHHYRNSITAPFPPSFLDCSATMPPKIPAHVFGYTLATIPGVMYAIYYKRNHQSDEEFEEMLRKNYSNNIEGSKAKRQEFSTFLQGIKEPNSNTDTEKKMEEVLRGGRGETKRHYAVNKELYGTEEGVRLRQEAEEEQKQQIRKKDQRHRGRKGEDGSKDWKDELEEASMAGGGSSKTKAKKNKKGKRKDKKASDVGPDADNGVSGNIGTKQVALVTVVAAAAAGLGFILGGKRQ